MEIVLLTIPERFLALSDALQPQEQSIKAAESHVFSVVTRLKSNFSLNKSLLIGSTSRNTAIEGYSDVDLLAVFSRNEARVGERYVKSDTFLKRIRDDLDARFHATEVRRDGQAAVLNFAQGEESVDVVPAIFCGFKGENKSPVYWIPDGTGAWIETAPEAHGKYLKLENIRSGGKLRKTVQLLKHWKNSRKDPIAISSIHIELLLASNQTCVGMKGYAQCLYEAFFLLYQRQCRGLIDPLGVAGTLACCQTAAQVERLYSCVQYAKEHSASALIAESRGNIREAARQWGLVFNGAFPI